jgi:hypothetical protein
VQVAWIIQSLVGCAWNLAYLQWLQILDHEVILRGDFRPDHIKHELEWSLQSLLCLTNQLVVLNYQVVFSSW